MDTPAVGGAFAALAELTEGPFEGRVHLVSKAGPKTAETTRRWLAEVGFYGRTGILPSNLHFVRDRADKAPVCERLGVTHFIDDRIDVLGHLTTVPYRYLFVGGLGRHAVPLSVPRWACVADDWLSLREQITQSVR
jgi:hypothetical protein